MKSLFPRLRPALLPLRATALCVLLALLAVLQYRWLGQVSDGERQRLKATLEARARDFSRDFDREITRAVSAFHLSAPAAVVDGDALAARWDEWRQSATHPDLIRDVFSLDMSQGAPALRRLDRGARTLEPAEWPPELKAWHEVERAGPSLTPADMQGLWSALENSPTVLVAMPLVRFFSRSHAEPPVVPQQAAATSFVLVQLDLDQIRSRLLPQLVSRYFSTEDIFDYRVSVVQRRDPTRVLFRSEPAAESAPGGRSGPFDAVVPLFAVRLAEFSAFAIPRVGQEPGGLLPAQAAGVFAREEAGGAGRRAGQPAGGAAGAAGAAAGTDHLTVSVIRLRSGSDGTMAFEAGSGRWQLQLAHRAGSVDAAVARARNRNLLVSSTVLVLLAASFALMVVATRRAQRLAAQQVEFVAGVTHDLRTPLTVIRSAGENLADGVLESWDEVRQYGALITSEGRKLGTMVERVMEYAGMQGTTTSWQRDRVDVARLLDEAARAARRLPIGLAARVETDVADGLPPVLGDGAALGRAVENLIENALKYGQAEGAVPWVRVSARSQGAGSRGRVVIEVTDGGPGVEPSEREAIFEPFVRGRAAVAARIPGTGLGLSLVRRVVGAHGGRVEVHAPEGGGACFAISLPAADRVG